MDFRSLSQTEAKVILALEAEGREIVSLTEIRKRTGASPGFARKLAHELVRKGWLQRVRQGTYLLEPEPPRAGCTARYRPPPDWESAG